MGRSCQGVLGKFVELNSPMHIHAEGHAGWRRGRRDLLALGAARVDSVYPTALGPAAGFGVLAGCADSSGRARQQRRAPGEGGALAGTRRRRSRPEPKMRTVVECAETAGDVEVLVSGIPQSMDSAYTL